MITNRLTEMLQCDHPVMLAGMGGVSYHEVVAAVSEAGGFGCLGASTMGRWIRRSRITVMRWSWIRIWQTFILTWPMPWPGKVNSARRRPIMRRPSG